MRRSLLSAGLGLTLTGLLAVPALAGPVRSGSGPDGRALSTWATVDSVSISGLSHDRLALVPRYRVPSDSQPTDVRPGVRPDGPEHNLEVLTMACHGRVNDEGRAAIGCEWSASELERAAGYRLERADGDVREVVFRTDDITQTMFVDIEITVGQRYIYRVVVVDAAGGTIGIGGPVKAGTEADRHLEALTMTCQARADAPIVGCQWEPVRSNDLAGYQLWRAVDRDGRELIHRGGLDFTHYVDEDLKGAAIVHYAVIAVDASGETIGRSRAVTIRFGDEPGPRPTVDVRSGPVAPVTDVDPAQG